MVETASWAYWVYPLAACGFALLVFWWVDRPLEAAPSKLSLRIFAFALAGISAMWLVWFVSSEFWWHQLRVAVDLTVHSTFSTSYPALARDAFIAIVVLWRLLRKEGIEAVRKRVRKGIDVMAVVGAAFIISILYHLLFTIPNGINGQLEHAPRIGILTVPGGWAKKTPLVKVVKVDPYKVAIVFQSSTTDVRNLPEHQGVIETWGRGPWNEETFVDVRLSIENQLVVPLQNLDLTIDVGDGGQKHMIGAIGQLTNVSGVEFHWLSPTPMPPIRLFGKDGRSYRHDEAFEQMRIPAATLRVTCPRLLAKDKFRLILGVMFDPRGTRNPPDHLRVTGTYEMSASEGSTREHVDQIVIVEQ